MLASLFDGESGVLHAQYSDFLSQVEHGQIRDVVLAGYQDKGFFVFGRIKNDDLEIPCVLVTQHSEIRYIKCPDNAHTFLYNMGIEEFMIDASTWDMDSAFNPHKVSHESRQRKKRREDALRHRPLYLDKFRYAYNDVQIEERIQMLVDCAVEQGWLEQSKEISKKRFFTWFDKRELPDNKKVPAWAMKAAAVLATDQEVYPRNELEISVFACLWSSIHGPFDSLEQALESLPEGFISKVTSLGGEREWIDTAFNDEVLHARYVERKERQYQESQAPGAEKE
jgi:hypothetical protein